MSKSRETATLRPSTITIYGVPAYLLHRFQVLMSDEGLSVQLQRMCFDRIYALERIASAHATRNEALRQLALRLFHAYQGSRDIVHKRIA